MSWDNLDSKMRCISFRLMCPFGKEPPELVGESQAKLERGLDEESFSHTK